MIVTFLLTGLGAGILSGIFGIGGGIVIVPSLLFFARMEIATATGTSLGALLLPVGALGAWSYYRNGHLNVKGALLVALGLFVGAWLGAQVAQGLSPAMLKRAFAVLLAGIAVRVWFTAG